MAYDFILFIRKIRRMTDNKQKIPSIDIISTFNVFIVFHLIIFLIYIIGRNDILSSDFMRGGLFFPP